MLAEESLVRFIEDAPVAVALLDREMRYLAASRLWLEHYGLLGEPITGRSHLEAIPDLPPEWRVQYLEVLDGKSFSRHEARWVRADGSSLWLLRALRPWRTSDDSVAGLVIFAEDVTARKAAEKAQADSEARIRAVLDTSRDAIIAFDRGGIIADVNPATEAMFGYSRAELIGSGLEGLLPSPSADGLDHYIRHCIRADDAQIVGNSIETQTRRRDGGMFEVELAVGQIDHLDLFTVTIRDISARKRAEQALLASHAELEQRVRERTQALEAAKREAERANAFKSRFLAAASHDLRQPLQSLSLYLSVLARQLDEPAQLEICDKMRKSRDTVARLLEALLDISRLESGVVKPAKHDFELQSVIERIIAANAPQAKEKGLRLHGAAVDCVVHTDSALLERVLDNLVGNAIRYTERGEVAIRCERDGEVVRISVVDSGVGIAPEALGAIFEEYYQIGSKARDGAEGLGLGLSIVKHIARLLEHDIAVSSAPEEGSTFTITVPLGRGAEQRRVSGQSGRAEKADPTVLLVDDEPAIVDATTLLLESAGLKVHAASSGKMARELLVAGVRPDMVVCDYRLPGTNGVQLIGELRRLAARELPAVLLTGDTSGQEIERAKLQRCIVLHKPIDADRLLDVIESSMRS